MIGARGEPFPQAISASKASVDLRNRRWDRADGCRKDPLEAGIVNPFEVLSQNRGGRLAGLQDRGAKPCAGATKKFELRAAAESPSKPVDFEGDPEHGQSVGIIQRHGIPQDRQMPGTQRAGVPLHSVNG